MRLARDDSWDGKFVTIDGISYKVMGRRVPLKGEHVLMEEHWSVIRASADWVQPALVLEPVASSLMQ